jgi:hypothetical protein
MAMSSVLDYIPLTAMLLGIVAFFLMRTQQDILIALAKTPLVFATFIFIFTFEFFIFGSFSFIGKESDSWYASAFYYLANIYDGSGFAKEIGGGQDAALLFDGVIFSVGRTLFAIFPPWIAILIHKIIIGALGFFGSFLLACRVGANRKVSAVLACIYPVSNIYLLNFSLEFETGFAAIPLAVYACISHHSTPRWLALIVCSAVVLALAQPMKVFPAFIVAVIGGWILAGGNPKRVLLGIALHILAAFANWFNVLASLRQLVGLTTRGFEYNTYSFDPLDILEGTINLFVGYPSATAGILTALLLAWYQRDPGVRQILSALAWFVAAYVLAKGIPWQTFGFGYLNKVEHSYMRLALGTISIMSFAKTFAVSGNPSITISKKISNSSPYPTNQLQIILLFSIALAFHINSKLTNAAQWIAFGGQSSVFGFNDLYDPPWKPDQLYRVVTIADAPHPNVIAGVYGLEAFDGSIQLNPISWNTYWNAIKRTPFKFGRTATRPSLDWRYWDGTNYNLDRALDVELLAIANVRHIISPIPLISKKIKEVAKPIKDSWKINRPDLSNDVLGFITHSIKRIFSPGKHFVYEVSGALSRILPASKVIITKTGCDQKCFFDLVKIHAPSGGVVINKNDGALTPRTSELDILGTKKIKNGFRIKINAPNGGVLIFNQSPTPGWTAEADGSDNLLPIVYANGIHMAISIPPKTKVLKLRYLLNGTN